MHLTQVQRATVERYIAEDKFAANTNYMGWMSEDVVADPNAALNDLARRALGSPTPTRSAFLNDANSALNRFKLADTEDRERALLQIERLKQAIGLPAFEGRLAAFRHDIESGNTL